MAERSPPAWVPATLGAMGLFGRAGILRDDVVATRLVGGVSAEVWLAEDPDTHERFVLKRPREWFRVVEKWRVPVSRAHVEAEAARLFTRRLPVGSVAPLVGVWADDGVPVLVFKAAGADWRTWKQLLLSGAGEPAVAGAAGRLLARVHAMVDSLAEDAFAHDDLFHAQRIEPYLVTSARRLPGVARHVARLQASFFQRKDLVHGDFSPKNLLVAPEQDRVMLIDHEVVTRGDAAFDLAFLWTHLALKAVHRPAVAMSYLACAQAAAAAYRDADVGARPEPEGVALRAVEWVPALLLARVVGKSPVEYLGPAGRARVVATAQALLKRPPGDLPGLWEALPGETG